MQYLKLSMTGAKITRRLERTIKFTSSREDRRASYQAVETAAFFKLEDTAARTENKCAMDCIKTPACFTFRLEEGVCSLGGYGWL